MSSYAYLVVSWNPANPQSNYPLHVYRGENAIKHFWQQITAEVQKIGKHYCRVVLMKISDEQLFHFQNEVEHKCHICGNSIARGNAVCDHCHLTGEYRGPACSVCNKKYLLPNFVPILFYSASSYDMKFLIKQLSTVTGTPSAANNVTNDDDVDQKVAVKKVKFAIGQHSRGDCSSEIQDSVQNEILQPRSICDSRMSVIATNSEKFITISKKLWFATGKRDRCGKEIYKYINARFLDSSRFLESSLAKLAESLPQDRFIHTRKYFPDCSNFELVTQKNFFPYEYITDASKYDDSYLPSREAFASSLANGSTISEYEYEFAQKVYRDFNCKTLGDYSDLYVKIDVLLLAEVFEEFRRKSNTVFNLDPSWYISLPGYVWSAALKYTNASIELITDKDMFLLFKSSKRGGFVFVNRWYAEANHPALPEPLYDPKKPHDWIFYIDCNNLYGYAMCQPLPIGEYSWLD